MQAAGQWQDRGLNPEPLRQPWDQVGRAVLPNQPPHLQVVSSPRPGCSGVSPQMHLSGEAPIFSQTRTQSPGAVVG